MSTFHVCVMRGGWAITMLIREKDSRKKTEDIAYYISPIVDFILSSIRSSVRAISILLQRLLTYVKVLRRPQHADGPWPAPMTLRFCGNDGIVRVPQWLSTSRDGHKVSVNYNSLIKCALDAVCHTHMEKHTRNHARRENWDINWFEVQPSGEGCKSQSHYVCVCARVYRRKEGHRI